MKNFILSAVAVTYLLSFQLLAVDGFNPRAGTAIKGKSNTEYSYGETINNQKIGIKFDNNTIESGQPAQVSIEIKNAGDEKIYLPVCDPKIFSLCVYDPKNDPVKANEQKIRKKYNTLRQEPLEPGKSIKIKVNLTEQYNLAEPGEYKLQASCMIYNGKKGSKGKELQSQLNSRQVKFTITKAAEENDKEKASQSCLEELKGVKVILGKDTRQEDARQAVIEFKKFIQHWENKEYEQAADMVYPQQREMFLKYMKPRVMKFKCIDDIRVYKKKGNFRAKIHFSENPKGSKSVKMIYFEDKWMICN